ncbi:MAG: hypothetical protein NZM43_00420 [Saprospiraceae bacterium]|nr:hypothetical protein [Saprospiraceae bacterium]MDW8482765.1 hypothetical protein [Saprospiraceae bacterium]
MNLNTQFVFDSKLKRNLIIGMVVGALCLVWSAIGDDAFYTRFWSNYLHNAVFFTGIAFTAMFFLSGQITAFAGWMVVIKRLWEAMSLFMLVGIGLLLVVVIGVWGHLHHLYHWNMPGITDPSSPIYDKVIAGKAGFLNPVFFTVGTVGFLAIWYFWAYKLRQNSLAQDKYETPSFDYYKRERKWAASFLPLGGFLSTVFLWLLVMSIDPHWYSTMFAWYSTVSLFLGGLALFILLVLYLKAKGYLEYVTRDHLHDLGKYLFGISIFWTYLWFDQFMLIWYGNIGEETIYFKERMENYPILFWGNLVFNFVTPFFVLMRNSTKRKVGTMFFAALIVFLGHWLDFFYMIKPGVRLAAQEAIELSEGAHHSSLDGQLKHHGKDLTQHVPHALAAVGSASAAEQGHHSTAPSKEHQESKETQTSNHPTSADGHAPIEEHVTHASAAEQHHDGDKQENGHSSGFQLGYSLPGFQEIGVLIGFLSLFLFFFFRQLERAPLLPLRDPYLEESLHHTTGVYLEEEEADSVSAHH